MKQSNATVDSRAEFIERWVTLITVLAPLGATGRAIYFAWQRWVEPRDFFVAGAMYVATVIGITLGFHRLFTHKSFKCAPVLRALLGIAGSMAAQGPLFFWVRVTGGITSTATTRAIRTRRTCMARAGAGCCSGGGMRTWAGCSRTSRRTISASSTTSCAIRS